MSFQTPSTTNIPTELTDLERGLWRSGMGVASQDDLNTLDGEVVKKTGNQTIAGIKTFSSFPLTPSSAPTTNYQVANKKLVDDSVFPESIAMVDSDGSILYSSGKAGASFPFNFTKTGTGVYTIDSLTVSNSNNYIIMITPVYTYNGAAIGVCCHLEKNIYLSADTVRVVLRNNSGSGVDMQFYIKVIDIS